MLTLELGHARGTETKEGKRTSTLEGKVMTRRKEEIPQLVIFAD